MTGKGSPRLIVFGILVISLFLFPHKVMAIEVLKYRVLEKAGDFELRQYQPYIVAETLVEGSFQRVGNEGFRRLVAYIQGNNHKQQAIPMTAPVTQEDASEQIPMTAPVGQEKVGGKWRITFVMPSSYTRQTLPEPLDPRIKLVEVPQTLMAAVRYSGFWSRSSYEAQEKRLREFIRRKGLKIVGEPIFARYNSPFMLWFMRRNEVLIPVARVQ
jgi:effector-binding domain-containing protein